MTLRNLYRNEQGAIMLIALFFAICAVAMLYYLIGLGHAILFREKLQDAADAAALSAALMHARAMNLIVLINLVMAAILSVLVTIKLVQALSIIGIALAAGLAWVTFGATLAAIPPLQCIDNSMHEAYEELREPVFGALEILHTTAGVVAEGTPWAADALSVADIRTNTELLGLKGAAVGACTSLPVENDTFPELCGRAGKFPVMLAESMLGSLPGMDAVLGELVSPMQDLTSSLSAWFCGDGGTRAPSRDYTKDISYPRTELADTCRDSEPVGSMDNLKLVHSDECDKSQRDEVDAQPDPNTGDCQVGHNCALDGPYEKHVALARTQCDPGIAPFPKEYTYQLRTAHVEYRWKDHLWVRSGVTYDTPSYHGNESRQPCGPGPFPPTISGDYNPVVRFSNDINEVRAVCSNESALLFERWLWDKAVPHYLTITEVTQILGCVRDQNVHVDLSGGQPAGDSGQDKAPKKILASVHQFGDDFQIRALLHADLNGGISERIVKLSLWSHDAPRGPSAWLRGLTQFSLAQAEYLYDGIEPRSEWLWNMKWRARLRRFYLPKSVVTNLLGEACGAIGNSCDLLMGQVSKLKDFVAH